jgi:WD40 repeat protein
VSDTMSTFEFDEASARWTTLETSAKEVNSDQLSGATSTEPRVGTFLQRHSLLRPDDTSILGIDESTSLDSSSATLTQSYASQEGPEIEPREKNNASVSSIIPMDKESGVVPASDLQPVAGASMSYKSSGIAFAASERGFSTEATITIDDISPDILVDEELQSTARMSPLGHSNWTHLDCNYSYQKRITNVCQCQDGDTAYTGAWCSAISPKVLTAAVGQEDGSSERINRSRIQALYPMVTCIAFNLDTRRIVCGHMSGTISLWTFSGDLTRVLPGSSTISSHVSEIVFALAGRDVLYIVNGLPVVKHWDLVDGKDRDIRSTVGVGSTEQPSNNSIAVDSKGLLLAAYKPPAKKTESEVMIFGLQSGKIQCSLPLGSQKVERLTLSGNGQYLALCMGTTVTIWDVPKTDTFTSFRRLVTGGHPYGALTFSPDSKLLAGAYDSPWIDIWTSSNGQRRLLNGSLPDLRIIQDIAFSPSNTLIALGCIKGLGSKAGAEERTLCELATADELQEMTENETLKSEGASSASVFSTYEVLPGFFARPMHH